MATVRLLDLGLLAIEPGPDHGPVDDFQTALEHGNPVEVRLRFIRRSRREFARLGPKVKCSRSPVRSARSASRMDWSRSSGWVRSGSAWEPSLCVRLNRGRSTNAIGTGSRRTRSSPAPSPMRWGRCLIRPRSGWRWACHVGLIELDPTGERLLAAPPEFWTDNAVHLPHMIATGWLAMRTWQETEGVTVAKTEAPLAVPYLRIAVMLWLAALGDSDWVALDDLAEHLSSRWPAWDRLSLSDDPAGSNVDRHKSGKLPRNRAGAERAPLGPRLLEYALTRGGLSTRPGSGQPRNKGAGVASCSSLPWDVTSWRWGRRPRPARPSSISSLCSRTSRSSPIARD